MRNDVDAIMCAIKLYTDSQISESVDHLSLRSHRQQAGESFDGTLGTYSDL